MKALIGSICFFSLRITFTHYELPITFYAKGVFHDNHSD